TGSALHAVRPPNLHITPDVGAISLDLQRGRIIVALASSHHRPRHPGQLVGKRDRGDFGVSPCQQCCEPRRMLGSATTRSSSSTPLRPTGATMPNSAR